MSRLPFRAVPLVCWSVAVVAASVVDPPSGSLAATGPFGLGVDTWIHLGAYAATAFLAGVALRAREVRGLLVAVAVAVALGGAVELVQATLPARTDSVGDLLANAVGALAGVTVYVAAGRRTWVSEDE